MVYWGQNCSIAAAATAEVGIEDSEDIEENIVTVGVEVVEETNSRDGNSSIPETTT